MKKLLKNTESHEARRECRISLSEAQLQQLRASMLGWERRRCLTFTHNEAFRGADFRNPCFFFFLASIASQTYDFICSWVVGLIPRRIDLQNIKQHLFNLILNITQSSYHSLFSSHPKTHPHNHQ